MFLNLMIRAGLHDGLGTLSYRVIHPDKTLSMVHLQKFVGGDMPNFLSQSQSMSDVCTTRALR